MPKLALTLQFPAAKTFPEHKALLPRATVASWIKASLFANAELTVRFVDTKEGRTLNRSYRQKDYATNVLTFAFDLWERAFHEIGAKDYPDIKRDYAHVDATTMWFVKNPEWFDVIVTDNMFGDIITDLAAMIQGGLGVAAGGNINPEGTSMFEPMGGSAPKYTGQNVINPLAAINAAAMMLDFLGEAEAGAAIEKAAIQIINTKIQSLAAGKMGYTTTQVGDLVAGAL